jgi:hypothetical protein
MSTAFLTSITKAVAAAAVGAGEFGSKAPVAGVAGAAYEVLITPLFEILTLFMATYTGFVGGVAGEMMLTVPVFDVEPTATSPRR